MSDELFFGVVNVPECACGVCGELLDAVGTLGQAEYIRAPEPGDLTVCANCLAIGVFMEDGTFRPATSEECEEVPSWVRQKIAERTRHSKPS